MDEKYLPIGTVCTIKNSNKKVMITSYFSIEYNNSVVMYDYKGCVYPEGLLLPSQSISFNHSDIISIDYLGYKNNDFEIFNNNLKRKNDSKVLENNQDVITNFKFDENGVVIFDQSESDSLETNTTPNNSEVVNPFKINNNVDDNKKIDNEKDNSIFNEIKFDSNGVVIEDNSGNNNSGFVFDENGFVVSDMDDVENNNNDTNINNQSESEIKFDSNGVVTSDGSVEESNQSNIKFDENGIVVEEI